MNQKVKKLWVKALRSGKFKQGQGTLKQVTKKGKVKHCCLGVLCELHSQKFGRKFKIKYNPDLKEEEFLYLKETEVLPKAVAKWAGLENNPTVPILGSETFLSELNDSEDYTFNQLADLIEQHL